MHQRSIPRFLRHAVIKKRCLWHRYKSARSPVRLTAFKSQSRFISLLFRQYRSRRDLGILQTYNTVQFWRYYSRNMYNQTKSFPIPMVYGNKTINDTKE